MKFISLTALGLIMTLPVAGYAAQAPDTKAPGAKAPARDKAVPATERFEVSSVKAVRPTLVKTIAALQKQDVAGARAAFEAYDSAWNGIEVYISTRSQDMYDELEKKDQAQIADGLKAAKPDTAKLLADAKAILAKYDEAIAMVAKGAPLNRYYDDVARLRIVRSHLREVNPALMAGNIAKARKSFGAFNDTWDNIEQLVDTRSRKAYLAIESGMTKIEEGLKPAKPNVDQLIALVNGVMEQYNAILALVTKDAKNPPFTPAISLGQHPEDFQTVEHRRLFRATRIHASGPVV